MQTVARAVVDVLGKETAFVVLAFDQDPDGTLRAHYVSNGNREDIWRAVGEWGSQHVAQAARRFMIDALQALIASRDAIWHRLIAIPHGTLVDLTELTKLVQANEAVETALAAPEECELPAGFAAHQVESMRCTVCRGFIKACELELRHTLQRGNSAVLSAARHFLETQQAA